MRNKLNIYAGNIDKNTTISLIFAAFCRSFSQSQINFSNKCDQNSNSVNVLLGCESELNNANFNYLIKGQRNKIILNGKLGKNIKNILDIRENQIDILDKDLLEKYLKDADVVHHLAGVTLVPRTESEATDEQNAKIKLVAEQGTQNVLDAVSDKCKIIFPSTHVVYEGINSVKKDIE